MIFKGPLNENGLRCANFRRICIPYTKLFVISAENPVHAKMSENTFSTIAQVYGFSQSLLEEYGNTFEQNSLISSAARIKNLLK